MSVRDFGVSIIQGVRERAADQAALFLTLYNFSQYNEEVGIMRKENTEHCCCEGCDSSPETLLGADWGTGFGVQGKGRIADIGASYGTGNLWISAAGGTKNGCGCAGSSAVRGIGGGDLLFLLLHSAERRTHHPCLSRNGMLRAGRKEDIGAASGTFKREDRRYDRGSGSSHWKWRRCIGACGLAPAMSIDGQVYKQVNPDKLEQILARYYDENAECS